MRSCLPLALIVVVGLVGCSSSAFPRFSDPQQERLDVLTSFSLALSKRDYRAAAGYLGPEDRAKLADGTEGILPEYRDRVRAIRRATLLNNPLIEVRKGLIYGLPDVLPVLAQGRPDSLNRQDDPDTGFAVVPDSNRAEAAELELKRAAEAFFQAVSKRDWGKALGYLADEEREDFLDPKGKLRDDARRRLASADTSQWASLTLKDGKLTGVFLILPDPGPARAN
ncbi:MAG: hypothetical protein JF616_10630 [Fibrobacteres bacterium]|nr:hypothetical protein [Fibrobacterota bacterium]